MKFRLINFLTVALFGVQLFSPARAATEITFGVVPQEAPSELLDKWEPVLRWLSEKSELQLKFETAPDVPTFEKRRASGAYDLAYMNPYHYVVYAEKPGYRAFAQAKDASTEGIVVVPQGSTIRTLSDLSNQTIAFPTPNAFAATLIVGAELRRLKIPYKAEFVKSHNSVYRVVDKKLFPAGGGIPRTLDMIDESIKSNLRVIWRSPKYPSHAIAERKGFDSALKARILAAMTNMESDPEGKRRLKTIGFEGIVAAQDSDWDPVRRVKPQLD